jgi:two-component system, cell cycle sensor histidine kinase and response regulator CckA
MADAPLQVLIVEDQPIDAELIVRTLSDAALVFDWQRVDTEAQYRDALRGEVDIVLTDFNLPAFSAVRALELLQAQQLDVPLIVLSGSIGEDTAVAMLQRGAADYLLKDRLARLPQAIYRALAERRLRQEKRAAEAQMRFALEAARVGTWEADLTSGAVQWSDVLEALHGIPEGSFAGTYTALIGHVHPDDRATFMEALDASIRERRDSNIVYRTLWADGSTHWIRMTGRAFYDEHGTPLRAAGVSYDVTELRQLEDQYRQAQKMEAVGQLAGGIAHDFNNVLTAIKGFGILLAATLPEGGPQARDLAEIRRAADRAATLTSQILAFSRRQMRNPRVIDPRDAIRDIEPMIRRLIGADIELVVRASQDVGRVRADPTQIEQVIMNLVVNARDAMRHGGTLLLELGDVVLDDSFLRQHHGASIGRHVMLAVSDTGEGMDSATRGRVFEPFFTTKGQGKGTGLGLATVYGIVKQSGGSIWVYSEPGHGSSFKIYLPRVDEQPDLAEAEPEPALLEGTETVAVVEDDDLVRELARRALERLGYTVLAMRKPSEALSIAQPIDLLVTDVVLPEMSGPVLAEKMRSSRPGLRVLYMSGYTDDTIAQRGVLEDDATFLQKPFTPDDLARKVRLSLTSRGDR